ncbi:MAG: phosphate acetyltransferase [Candidatus Omnitrophica bacterium]|nr:phosphate acetyltransferase [Candidatus Omnitrophota bacterium]
MASRIEKLKDLAKKNPKKIVLPEGDEPRILQAASILTSKGLAKIILVGNPAQIETLARRDSISLDEIQIIDPGTYPRREVLVDAFYKARKHKGITKDDARSAVLGNRIYFASLLVKIEAADGFVAGASHTTSNVARAALYGLGLDKDIGVMSSSFIIELADTTYGDDGIFIFGDCGIVPDPSPQRLAGIAISSSRLYEEFFKQKARVALLSYSTKGSARGDSVDKVLKALEIVRKKAPGLLVDGELQLDAAIVPEVAKIKAPGSRVAGKANVLIFPNLDAGNISYKLVQRLGRARVVGPLLQGLNRPASDLSRGCGVEEIIDTCVATVIRAQEE